MSKKVFIVWFINLMAYVLLLSTVSSEWGTAAFVKVLITSAILFGSIWGTLIAIVKKKDKDGD